MNKNSLRLASFFPIKKSELTKFIPMCLFFFALLLVRNILRNVKDSLVATQLGSESISFIAIWVHVPMAFLALRWYGKLVSAIDLEKTFRVTLFSFVGFFAAFALLLFPNRNFFHPSAALVQEYLVLLPNLKWFILLWANWSVTLFVVVSELWAVIICSIAYWQLANKITSVEESTRFYIFFSSFGSLNLILSGPITTLFSREGNSLSSIFCNSSDSTEVFIKSLLLPCLLFCMVIFGLHRFLEKKVIHRQIHVDPHSSPLLQKKKKPELGLLEGVKYVFSSKYLRNLCIITFAYSATMTWSDGLIMCMTKKLYTSASDFCVFKSRVMSYTGLVTLAFSVLGSYLLQRVSWRAVALTIPIITLFSGGVFFFSTYGQLNFGIFSLSSVVFLAGMYSVLSRGAKYSLFDATKEMAYVPLTAEVKQKGQAAVDIVGDNIGKVLGSGLQFVLLTISSTTKHEDMTGVLAVLCTVACLVWAYAIWQIAKEYREIVTRKEAQMDDKNFV